MTDRQRESARKPAPPKKRVRDLADEFQVKPQDVISFLLSQGYFVVETEAQLNPSMSASVRRHFQQKKSRGQRRPARGRDNPRPGGRGRAQAHLHDFGDDEEALTIAKNLGLLDNPRPELQRPSQKPRSSRPPRQEFARLIRKHFPDFNASNKEIAELGLEWARYYFTPEQASEWWKAGLGPGDVSKAKNAASMGIRPADLGRSVNGRTVLRRMRDGESLTWIYGCLLQEDERK